MSLRIAKKNIKNTYQVHRSERVSKTPLRLRVGPGPADFLSHTSFSSVSRRQCPFARLRRERTVRDRNASPFDRAENFGGSRDWLCQLREKDTIYCLKRLTEDVLLVGLCSRCKPE